MLPIGMLPINVTALSAALVDGYCDTTGFGNAGACENDDKGSFSDVRFHPKRTTWDSAVKECASRCMQCRRCNYISVSIKWNDCSWFNECDNMRSLHREVVGHRTVRIRDGDDGENNHNEAAAALASAADYASLWAALRRLPPHREISCSIAATDSLPPHYLLIT